MKSLIILLLIIINALCQAQNEVNYQFPSDWQNYANPTLRKEALQIPETILQNISTKHLLELCLDYPYFIDIYFYEDFKLGFNAVLEQFNGLEELVKRQDIDQIIIGEYESLRDSSFSVSLEKDIIQGNFSYRCFLVELIASQDQVISGMKTFDKINLIKVSSSMLDFKTKKKEIFGIISYTSSSYLIIKLLKSEKSFNTSEINTDTINNFLEHPNILSKTTMETVLNYSSKIE